MDIPEIRTIIGPRRSGTTALLTAFTENSEVGGLYQPVMSGHWYSGPKKPDYRQFSKDPDKLHPSMKEKPKPFYVIKETIGATHDEDAKADLSIKLFPDDESIKRSRPLFMVRDPYQAYASWKKLGWASVHVFIDSYKKTLELFKKAQNLTKNTWALTYEHLMKAPRKVLETLSNLWNIPFQEAMVDWGKGYSPEKLNMNNGSVEFFKKHTQTMAAVSKANGLSKKKMNDLSQLTEEEKSLIEKHLMPIYRHFSDLSAHTFSY